MFCSWELVPDCEYPYEDSVRDSGGIMVEARGVDV